MIFHLVKVFLFCLLIMGYGASVYAHPHIFVDAYYKVDIRDNGIDHLEAFWLVDELTSTAIVMGFDADFDGDITGVEKEELIAAFDAFKEQGYFLKIEQDGRPILPHFVNIAELEVRNEQIWMRLEIFLPNVIDLKQSTLSLAFGDDTMYTALLPDSAGLVQLSGIYAESCTPVSRTSEVVTIDSWGDLHCY